MQNFLKSEEFNPYYGQYINQAPEIDICKGLQKTEKEFLELLKKIPNKKMTYAYAEHKWTIAEVVQHIINRKS